MKILDAEWSREAVVDGEDGWEHVVRMGIAVLTSLDNFHVSHRFYFYFYFFLLGLISVVVTLSSYMTH